MKARQKTRICNPTIWFVSARAKAMVCVIRGGFGKAHELKLSDEKATNSSRGGADVNRPRLSQGI
jgi:hypothetical protein